MEIRCPECASYLANDVQIGKNQGKIGLMVAFNGAMMLGEIVTGHYSGSMALTAEGWHMGSHVGALSITLLAYKLAKSHRLGQKLSFGAGKLIPLGGYTSAIVLGLIALLVVFESVERLFSPVPIAFNEAILVAGIGLVVNVISAVLLNMEHSHGHARHHGHEHHSHPDPHGGHVHDHNIRGASLHVVADAATSVLAIMALVLGKIFHWDFLDPFIGIIGSLVIFSWSYQLCRDTGWELLDGHSKTIDWEKLRKLVEIGDTRILDFHVWRIAPQAVACELVVSAKMPRGLEHYREILREEFSVQHIVVEERVDS